MPNILVCYKWVPDEQDIKIIPGSLDLDFSRAKYKISDYDRTAIEAAVQIAEKYADSTVTVLTFGGSEAKSSLKDALSRGPHKAIFVQDDKLSGMADSYVTANILAAAIRKSQPYDIILCGEGSSDIYAQQTAPRLAALLDLPVITFAAGIKVEGNQLTAVRNLGNHTETAKTSFPVVISVVPEANKPRIPSLKQVLGAAKKPVEHYALSDLALDESMLTPKVIKKKIAGAVMNRKNQVFKGEQMPAMAEKLIAALAKEGVL